MPKVDAEHLARRREEILDAARRCFARDGFAGTSMAAIVAESGLSTGAIYSYFKGKDELVTAVACAASDGAIEALDDDALDDLVEGLRTRARDEGQAKLLAQVWGLASTSPELATVVGASQRQLRDGLADAIEAHRADGTLPPGPRSVDVAEAFLAVCSGLSLLLAINEDTDVAPHREALRMLLHQSASI
ncbi:HTH-type transcriptional regulator BetI [Paraconexibacter sp. AEG42_29]|uniref:HTH-type transcriptional regulator BetI n=1 Tax=Paraconexibacter sp. AEG42_29 TaxID=2997339 RepID=A0AAU7AU29_9ACTN